MKFPKKIWINGRLADPSKPLISAFDRGFLYGDGCYETVRVYRGRVFRFDEHFRRFRISARGFGLKIPFSKEVFARGMARLLQANRHREATIRVTLSRGPGPLGFDPRPAKAPTVTMISAPTDGHPAALYEKGITLLIAKVRRNPKECLDPTFKSTNNLNNILAKMEAIRAGAYEALMLNTADFLAEGTISNVFFVSEGAVKTPSLKCGILAGVTRDLVARHWRTQEGFYRLHELLSADEVFITSTTMEIMPVTRVIVGNRKKTIGTGRVGPVARQLLEDYRKLIVG